MFFLFTIVSLIVLINPSTATIEDEREILLTKGINQFTSRFSAATSTEQSDKNLIMSPMSANVILALISMGARGETQNELNTALYLPDSDFTKNSFGSFMEKMNNISGLKMANKLYLSNTEQYQPEFKEISEKTFHSETQNVDFGSGQAADIINKWVEDKTNNKIKNLIPENSLTSDSKLVLVNAIYFKGTWANEFDVTDTFDEDFHVNNKEKFTIGMMSQTTDFKYAEIPEWDAKIIELPFKDCPMSMVFLLPNEIEGLHKIREKLVSGANMTEIMRRMKSELVSLSLPRFKIETTIDLKKVLPRLGIQKMFSNQADLSGMLKNHKDLYVSDAMQKAFIEVSETGVEAAAANYYNIQLMSAIYYPITPKVFNANHPFMFFITTNSGVPIFTGKFIKK